MGTDSIRQLLDRSAEDLTLLRTAYENSLSAKEISPNLKIDIKNLIGNLRSVLDYVARDIKDKHCSPSSGPSRFYFPILPDRRTFTTKCNQWFPGLRSTCVALWDYLESIQPYHDDYKWLGQFNTVNYENKHEHLLEQSRVESKRVNVKMSGGGGVSWDPSAVKFGRGVSIGGVPVNPQTQMPQPSASQKVEIVTWIDFRFDGIDISALGLLSTSRVFTELCQSHF